MIRFKANNRLYERPAPVSLCQFLEDIKLESGSVIVEYNREFLPKENYKRTLIQDGDTLEVIRAFAGG